MLVESSAGTLQCEAPRFGHHRCFTPPSPSSSKKLQLAEGFTFHAVCPYVLKENPRLHPATHRRISRNLGAVESRPGSNIGIEFLLIISNACVPSEVFTQLS